MSLALSVLFYVCLCYVALLAAVYLLQEKLFFRPERLPQDFVFDFGLNFDELFFETEKGASINALYFHVPNSKGLVFYCKGNSKSIKGWSKFARDFIDKGYDVLMFDYRGFGKSRGKRSEAAMYHDTQYLYDWAKTQYPEKKIIVYGRSLGSGFAAKIAADNDPRMLILDAPYYSFLHLIRSYVPFLPIKWVLRYRIYTHRFIRRVNCQVYVFHGSRDWTIPVWAGLRLARELGQQSSFISIRGAGHNNMRNFPKYHEQLYFIFKSL